jgi:hypothetical protein
MTFIAILNYLSYLFWMKKRFHIFWTKFEILDYFSEESVNKVEKFMK